MKKLLCFLGLHSWKKAGPTRFLANHSFIISAIPEPTEIQPVRCVYCPAESFKIL